MREKKTTNERGYRGVVFLIGKRENRVRGNSLRGSERVEGGTRSRKSSRWGGRRDVDSIRGRIEKSGREAFEPLQGDAGGRGISCRVWGMQDKLHRVKRRGNAPI